MGAESGIMLAFAGIYLNAVQAVPECLRVKAGQEINASRFETRRYAAIKGATTECA